jgi:hypothetical protein
MTTNKYKRSFSNKLLKMSTIREVEERVRGKKQHDVPYLSLITFVFFSFSSLDRKGYRMKRIYYLPYCIHTHVLSDIQIHWVFSLHRLDTKKTWSLSLLLLLYFLVVLLSTKVRFGLFFDTKNEFICSNSMLFAWYMFK